LTQAGTAGSVAGVRIRLSSEYGGMLDDGQINPGAMAGILDLTIEQVSGQGLLILAVSGASYRCKEA
jgi:hypothetical protein